MFPKGISQSLAISSQEFSLFDLYSMPHTKYLGLFFKSISTMHWLSSDCKFLSLLLHRLFGHLVYTKIYILNPSQCLAKEVSLKYRGPVQFSHSVVSDSLQPLAPQASLSITNSQSLLSLMSIESVMPSNHLISVDPFSACPQSFPASGSFQMSQLFTSGGQSIGVLASISVFPMKT